MSERPPPPEPLPVAVLDSHTHLDLGDDEPGAAVAAAVAVGVTRLVQVGIDVPSSAWGVEVANKHSAVLAAVAIHPNEAPRIAAGVGHRNPWRGSATPDEYKDLDLDQAIAEIDRLAEDSRVRAIGETGLDHFRTEPPGRAAQEESFRRHIDIAKRHRKALMIHDRDAHEDVFRVLDSEGAPDQVIFHCYSGDADMARRCAKRGWVMSFAGNVTFKANQHLRDAAAIAPPELILVETDAPFLTPLPYRGRPNGSYLIPITVRALAEIRGDDLDELCAAISDNGERIFGQWRP